MIRNIGIRQTNGKLSSSSSSSGIIPRNEGATTGPSIAQSSFRPSKANIILNLVKFFNYPTSTDPQSFEPSKAITCCQRDAFKLLVGLVEDLLERKKYTAVELLDQYTESEGGTSTENDNSDVRGWIFLALCEAFSRQYQPPLEEHFARKLIQLALDHEGALEQLFGTGLSIPSSSLSSASSSVLAIKKLSMLDECLSKSKQVVRLHYLHQKEEEGYDLCPQHEKIISSQLSWIDTTLPLGTTLLSLAARHRNPDAVLLLLRHGASIVTSWLNYTDVVQVLLYAPNEIEITEEDRNRIEQCLLYFCRARPRLDVRSLQEKGRAYYYCLLKDWEGLIPRNMHHDAPSLKHSCRCLIRKLLSTNSNLPTGISTLPLPNLLKNYLDLLL